MLVAKALISIFQNFIKIEETTHDHLKGLQDLVIDSSIDMLRFYYRKGDTFEIQEVDLAVIVALGSRCRTALKELVTEAAKGSFFGVKPSVAQKYVDCLYTAMPEDSTALLLGWIHTKVVEKVEKPAAWGNLL